MINKVCYNLHILQLRLSFYLKSLRGLKVILVWYKISPVLLTIHEID